VLLIQHPVTVPIAKVIAKVTINRTRAVRGASWPFRALHTPAQKSQAQPEKGTLV
jgi:hypothetical protein